MTAFLGESQAELALVDILCELGFDWAYGPDIAPDGSRPERADYAAVVLMDRLRAALARINPNVPPEPIEEALRRLMHPQSPSLIENNRRFHRMLTDDVAVENADAEGRLVADKVWPIDIANTANNDWLVADQFTVTDLPAQSTQAGTAGEIRDQHAEKCVEGTA